jgi:hypothetical protein
MQSPNCSSTVAVDAALLKKLSQDIKKWGQDLGFSDIGITDTDLKTA